MAGTVRDRMVDSAIVLLAERGFQATSFSAVLAASKAPRGSVYHHFPEGKNQLIAAAIELAGDRAVGLVDSLEGSGAEGIVNGFMAMWRAVLLRSDFTAGCSVLAVAVSSDSDALIEQAGATFRAWRERLARVLETGGIPAAAAPGFAAMLVAASEGAVVLSRAEQSLEPFEQVHAQLLLAARAQQHDAWS
ncbi:TetR/AcrR family transcriptional regulator [Compostimonas suwonensis]|uniref:AcrR family transcriptional regulator n=1 Tax=Compostimonas suwonensis TaxID=1048394 RepID=A0A2M9BCL1_9MICO|nr:TetR/AcrR family transcriptional regulator [Compostimonas suwonensis]PJJ55687.1 AcrR family transcriptional regulator [Compostimonas suwonensis]